MATLGARLRRLRRERECTLQEVSDGSGLTPSFLSRLERGIVNISVGNLRKVAAFFGVPITYFFTEEILPHGVVVRAAERTVFGDRVGGNRRESLLPEEADHLAAEIVSIAPGAEGETPLIEVSRSIFYQLSGELTYRIAGKEYRLLQGDLLYQRRPVSLRWSNEGAEEAVVLAASLRTEER